MKSILIKIILTYQNTISPDHSWWGKLRFPNGYCQYYPSCSEYARQSLLKYGLFKGLFSGMWRVIRCNPLSSGGVDMVESSVVKKTYKILNSN